MRLQARSSHVTFSHLFYSSTFHIRVSCVCISRLYCPSCSDRYYKLWQFLNLDEVTTVTDLIGEGKRVCQMSHDELSAYNYGRNKYERNLKYLPKYCFMSSYVTTLLRDGFGFPTNEHIHFVDEVAGYKVSVVVGFSLRCLAGVEVRVERVGLVGWWLGEVLFFLGGFVRI